MRKSFVKINKIAIKKTVSKSFTLGSIFLEFLQSRFTNLNKLDKLVSNINFICILNSTFILKLIPILSSALIFTPAFPLILILILATLVRIFIVNNVKKMIKIYIDSFV